MLRNNTSEEKEKKQEKLLGKKSSIERKILKSHQIISYQSLGSQNHLQSLENVYHIITKIFYNPFSNWFSSFKNFERNFVLHAGSYAENFATRQEILWFITMQNVEALGGI